jgi:hypothetical protein
MELLHDYQLNALARQVDAEIRFHEAQRAGLTGRPGLKLPWHGWKRRGNPKSPALNRQTFDFEPGS